MLFAGRSHPALAQEVAQNLGLEISGARLGTFPDGEISVEILDEVRGEEVFVVQSLAREPQLYLVELLAMIDALKRASAARIIPVIPYFGYARQDRTGGSQVPITARLVADLLETAGATEVVTLDLHAEQIQGFFRVPVRHIHAESLLIAAAGGQRVVIAPDVGSGIKMASGFVQKERTGAASVKAKRLFGDVNGKDVLLVDDMCATGATLVEAAEICKEQGAGSIAAAVTHGLFVGDALARIEESALDRIWVTNSVPGVETKHKIKVVSIAKVIADHLEEIHGTKNKIA